ncbi:hypothetical protein DBR11_28145 [Pedobacter sp. HMWF019]|uniref:hypothetical protein n=1 Tax=Pedobacter sp. HMWF019 TaxID=2056856 RepID=UPI000D33CADD|nr:hypothetical protein [Pedobacter sp. HMWF019]PTS91905.1 hypothetical protein DBR11_28145 [Pedobacter sp. HMWF019]
MLINFKKLFKPLICLGILTPCLNSNAQVAIFQNTIDKLSSYKNFSFQYIYKQKEAFGDTLIIDQKFIFLKAPEDKEIGYFFRHEFKYGEMKVPTIDLYYGKTQTSINSIDSTYQTNSQQAMTFNQSLLGQLTWIKTFLKKNPSKLMQLGDTIVNSINSYHLIINIRDWSCYL